MTVPARALVLARELFDKGPGQTAGPVAHEVAAAFDLSSEDASAVAAEAASWIAGRLHVACAACGTTTSVPRDEGAPWRRTCASCGHEQEHVVAPRSFQKLAPIRMSASTTLEVRDDAVYMVSRLKHGTEEVAVIAAPFEFVRVVNVEGDERIDVRIPKDLSGSFDEVARQLERSGRFLEPGRGRKVLAHLRHHHARTYGIGRGRETFEVFDDGQLRLPERCYPRPGPHTEEYERVRSILADDPPADVWRAYRELEDHLQPKEFSAAKAACAAAAFARVLRAQRVIVAAPFHVSTNSGVGKTKTAEAYATHAWNVELLAGEDLSSDFRFAHCMSGPGTTQVVDEAEKFDWKRYGANVKKGMESDTITMRGTRDLGMVKFASRRILIFTGNVLPRLPGPTLARLQVVRFREDRRNVTRDARAQFDSAFSRLGPVGPSLTRAALAEFPTLPDLMEAIGEVAKEMEACHGSFRDNRRARLWAVTFLFVGVWERASSGIHVAPDLPDFVRDVVAPVESDTFGAEEDRLQAFRSWLDSWVARNTSHDSDGVPRVRGRGDLFMEWSNATTDGRTIAVRLVTHALIQEFDRSQSHDGGVKIGSLNELARLVAEAYPLLSGLTLDDRENAPRHYFEGGQRKRAVPVPLADADLLEML